MSNQYISSRNGNGDTGGDGNTLYGGANGVMPVGGVSTYNQYNNNTPQAYAAQANQMGGPYFTQSQAYSTVNTQPTYLKGATGGEDSSSRHQIIIVDPPLEPYVKSYMTWSMINILLCCCLPGLVTTFLSCNVMRLNDEKKYKDAFKLSGIVLLGNMIATGVGAFLYIVLFPHVYLAIYPYLPKINY
jgi:hypothetical protein